MFGGKGAAEIERIDEMHTWMSGLKKPTNASTWLRCGCLENRLYDQIMTGPSGSWIIMYQKWQQICDWSVSVWLWNRNRRSFSYHDQGIHLDVLLLKVTGLEPEILSPV